MPAMNDMTYTGPLGILLRLMKLDTEIAVSDTTHKLDDQSYSDREHVSEFGDSEGTSN